MPPKAAAAPDDRGLLPEQVMRPLVENLEAALGAVDATGAGLLSLSELREALMVLDEVEDLGLTNAQIDALLSVAPRPPTTGRKAGMVDWREYVATVKSRVPTQAQLTAGVANAAVPAGGSKRGKEVVKYDHLRMAGRHVPKETMASLAASTFLIQNSTVVLSSSTVINAPRHHSNLAPASSAGLNGTVHAQLPGPLAPREEARVCGGASCKVGLAEVQELLSVLRLEEVGRGGGARQGAGGGGSSVGVTSRQLQVWADAMSEGISAVAERDRLASAIPRYEEAVQHTVVKCVDRWADKEEVAAGMKDEVAERLKSLSQVMSDPSFALALP